MTEELKTELVEVGPKESKTKLYLIIGGVALALLFAWVVSMALLAGGMYYLMSRKASPTPAPTPAPTSQITEMLDGHPDDAAKIAGVFKSLADVLEKDTEGLVGSTEDLRQANGLAGRLSYGTTLKGKYPGLAEAVDAELVKALGKQRRGLDAELRRKAVEALRNVSSAAKAAT